MGIKEMLSSRFDDVAIGGGMEQKHSEQGSKDVAIAHDSYISPNCKSILIRVFIQLMMLGRYLPIMLR